MLSPMPTRRSRPAVISHDSLLLVTGGVAEDVSTVLNTTYVLDLTTMKWSTPEGLNFPIPLWGHHLALCGEYVYLVGGVLVYPWRSPEDDNSQAWRAKWSDVKQTTAPQHSQPQRGVWTRIADPPTMSPTAVSCGGISAYIYIYIYHTVQVARVQVQYLHQWVDEKAPPAQVAEGEPPCVQVDYLR